MINSLDNQWLVGFISGIIATIIGFIFTMLWDIYKYRRDQKSREKNLVLAFKEELKDNLEFIQHNDILLSQELEVIKNEKYIVSPLIMLQNDFWDLMKTNLPKVLTKEDILIKIKKVYRVIIQLNEQIESRENYRINNQGYTNYNTRMKMYDETMIIITKNLSHDIQDLLKDINELQKNYIKNFFCKIKNVFKNLNSLIKQKLNV